MIKVGFALLLASALGVARGWAQTPTTGAVRGVVLTEQGRRPLQGALVRVLDYHVAENTHVDGSFLIGSLPVGSHRLLVSAIGYRASLGTVQVVAGDTTSVEVLLAEAVLRLEEIVTTGTVGARAQSETLSPTSVVSGATLDRQLDGTIAASLRHEPGVAQSGISPGTSQPVIRGLSGDRVLVLQDGLRVGDLSSMSADHAVAVDPLTAQRIEVVRGPMSLLYGSSALGGVVNVVRQDVPATVPDNVHGTVSAQASSVNRGGTLGGFATAGFGQLAARVEATVRAAGDTRTPVGRLTNTDLRTVDLAAGASLVRERGHAGLSYRFFDTEYGIPGGFVGGHETGVDVAFTRHTIRASAETHPSNGRWESLTADGGLTLYDHTEFEPSGAVGTRFNQTFATATLRARHHGLLGAASGAVGLSGLFRSIRTGGGYRTPSTIDFSVAGFAVQEYGRGPLRFQAGLRYDMARYVPQQQRPINLGDVQVPTAPRTFGSLSGSLGVLADLGAGLKLGASVARAHRTPDFNELYSNGPHLAANSYDVGDPRLEAESGFGLDGFVRFDRSRIRAEVAAFRNRLSNYVFPSSRGRVVIGRQGGRPIFQYTNEGALFSGIEGNLGIHLVDRLVLDATASYVAARFTSDRATIPVITLDPPDTTFVVASSFPPLIPPAFGTTELRYESPAFFFGAGVRWAARQGRTGDFESPTDGYVVGDLHAGVRLLLGGRFHAVTVRVDNLTNRQYQDHLSRIKIEPQPGAEYHGVVPGHILIRHPGPRRDRRRVFHHCRGGNCARGSVDDEDAASAVLGRRGQSGGGSGLWE
ncbi:MAG: TonB-dependent receptor [Gemmatimonadales bacterium]